MKGNRAEDLTRSRGASWVPRLGLPGHVYDLIVFAGLAGMGVWFLVGALGIEGGRSAVDPGTVPMIAGGLLVALCAAGAAQSLRTRRSSQEVEVARPLQVLLAMTLILVFPPAIDRFGYYITAALWIPAMAWVAGARAWTTCLLVTGAVLALARFVFEMTLGTPLP